MENPNSDFEDEAKEVIGNAIQDFYDRAFIFVFDRVGTLQKIHEMVYDRLSEKFNIIKKKIN